MLHCRCSSACFSGCMLAARRCRHLQALLSMLSHCWPPGHQQATGRSQRGFSNRGHPQQVSWASLGPPVSRAAGGRVAGWRLLSFCTKAFPRPLLAELVQLRSCMHIVVEEKQKREKKRVNERTRGGSTGSARWAARIDRIGGSAARQKECVSAPHSALDTDTLG